MKPMSTGIGPAEEGASTVWLWPPKRGWASYTVTRWRWLSSQAADMPAMPCPITATFCGTGPESEFTDAVSRRRRRPWRALASLPKLYAGTGSADHLGGAAGAAADPNRRGLRKGGMHAIAFDQAGYQSRSWAPARPFAAGAATDMTTPRPATDGFADMICAIAARADRQAFAALFEHFAPRVKSCMLKLG